MKYLLLITIFLTCFSDMYATHLAGGNISVKDLGYNKEAVYVVRLGESDPKEVLKQELLKNPKIKSIAATNLLQATGDSGATFKIKNEDGESSRDIVSMASVDNDYLQLMRHNE